MAAKAPLGEYHERRDFARSPEPRGDVRSSEAEPIFVIQKHAARALHYDLRLEVDGVLRSWAVPKGPSLNPRDKRLAVPTEDHPMDYADFEGIIPEGEYGAGTVIVWDTGTYRNLKERDGQLVPMAQCLEEGHLMVRLEGKKLRGGYGLVRTGKGSDRRWLLIKMADEEADRGRDIVTEEPRSVISGRMLEEVAAGRP